jgi:hypothetical protein
MSEENLSVFVKGFNNEFKSRNAITKFKQYVKTNKNYADNLVSLSHNYLNDNYRFKFISHSENGHITFEVYKTESDEEIKQKEELKLKHEMLKYKLKAMGLARANKSVSEKENDNLFLYSEYLKLSKMYKLPLPAPNVVLKEPSKYKKVVDTALSVLANQQTHPLYTYMKTLSNKINQMVDQTKVEEEVPELVTNPEVNNLDSNLQTNNLQTTKIVEESTEEEEDC